MKLYFDYAWQPAVRDRRSVHVKRVIAGIQKEDFPKYLAFEFVPNSAPSNVVRFKKWNHDRAQLLPIAEINWGSGDATGTITTLETNSSVCTLHIAAVRELSHFCAGTNQAAEDAQEGVKQVTTIRSRRADIQVEDHAQWHRSKMFH